MMKLGVLISGRGSNLQALIDARARGKLSADIALVVSNRPNAGGLERAKAAGIETKVIDHTGYGDRDAFDAALTKALAAADVDLVCLAGFLRLLQQRFVDRWHGKLINIHPSLLPAFRGLKVHERVIAAGVRVSGCTVHYVTSAVDEGPIVIQAAVPVLPDDRPDDLAARVLEAEHRIYPAAVRLIAEGRAHLDGNRVVYEDRFEPAAALINPPAARS